MTPRLLPFLALAALCGACSREGEPGADSAVGRDPVRNVILISLDTTRADQLGCYGNADAHTPELDRLAAEGVRFEHVQSAAPSTLSSHASLFTGTWPHTHGVVRNGFELLPQCLTLAEALAQAGYETAGFVGSFALDRRFGIAQGFSVWDERFDLLADPSVRGVNERRAEDVTDSALAWLDTRAEPAAPLFLFVHYFDVHASYDPPPPFDRLGGEPDPRVSGSMDDLRKAVLAHQRALGGPELGLDQAILGGLPAPWLAAGAGAQLGDDRELARRYGGELAYVDHQIGRLLAGLEQRGLLADALVIVTADHGETFWEHADFWNHGLAVYDTTVRVPLIVRLPQRRGAGTVVRTPLSNVDVMPSVLELAGAARVPSVEGVSFAPALAGDPFERGAVFSNATQPSANVEGKDLPWRNVRKAQCVRLGDWKLVETPYLGTQELYDLARDPQESVNLLASPDAAALAKRDELHALLEQWRAQAQPLRSRFVGDRGDHTEERLKQLGYTGK